MAKEFKNPANQLTIVDILRKHAREKSKELAYKFISEGSTDSITYAGLDAQSRAVASWLQQRAAKGERAVLLLPPGLSYITAFLGCLYAGVIAVPAYPPRKSRHQERLQAIIDDSGATLVITCASIASRFTFAQHVLVLEEVDTALGKSFCPVTVLPDDIALLQYTSGSTGQPKGVMVTHGNIVSNVAATGRAYLFKENDIVCSWLPPYHDMGLIGGIICPMYHGFLSILMAPTSFISAPLRWIDLISTERVTISGGPNFAYDLCVQAAASGSPAVWDLSSWRIAFNGAEPISAETIRSFHEAFMPHGLNVSAACPNYGMAEATLMLTSKDILSEATVRIIDKSAFEQGSIVYVAEDKFPGKTTQLVGCGYSDATHELIIVDAATHKQCAADTIGEIWVRGSSIAKGYWDNPELTKEVFEAYLCETHAGPYLRTGDLGFLDDRGELFITGRIKDLIIVHGRNIYPQDIELSVSLSHTGLIPNGCAAFSLTESGKEQLVIVQEVRRHAKEHATILEAMLERLWEDHELVPFKMVLIGQASLPKTSSGKVQRSYCRTLFLNDQLVVLGSWAQGSTSEHDSDIPSRATTEDEIKIRSIWGAVLGIPSDQIGIQDDFFRLGGNSILATKLASKLNRELGSSVSVSAIFTQHTVALLAHYLKYNTEEHVTISKAAVSKSEEQLLSFAQERLWFIEQYEQGTSAYNIPMVVRLSADVDLALLERSIQCIVHRHEILRTLIKEDQEGSGYQVVLDDLEHPLVIERVQASNTSDLAAHVKRAVHHVYNLQDEYPIRVCIYALSDPTTGSLAYYLSIVVHHIAFDGWSVDVLPKELQAHYNYYLHEQSDTPAPLDLPALSIQYKDFALWQRSYLTGETLENQLGYWRSQLDGYETLHLVPDKPRPTQVDYSGSDLYVEIEEGTSTALRELAKELGVSLYSVLLSGYYLMLRSYSSQDDIVIGTPVANRHYSQIENLIGFFVNTLALRSHIDPKALVRDYIQSVGRGVIAAQQHQDLPFERLVEALYVAKDTSRHPLFQVMFGVQGFGRGGDVGGSDLFQAPDADLANVYSVAKFDMTTMVDDSEACLQVSFNYANSLFSCPLRRGNSLKY
jgi:acyl-CoA synthetase (AMP-forming)/AMP-acid ligase II